MSDILAREDLFYVTIRATKSELLAQLMKQHALDFGCRPNPMRNIDGGFTIRALATKDQINALQQSGFQTEVGDNATAIAKQRMQEVGTGDRFEGGRITPRGLGHKFFAQ